MLTNKKRPHVPASHWTIISFIVGMVITITAYFGVSYFNHQHAKQAALDATEATADAVVNRIKLYQYGLRGARGAIQAMGEKSISREAFDRYSRSRNVAVEFPGARGFGFIRRVSRQDEAQFLVMARSDGWPDFAIRELAPHENERFVIQYISNLEVNKAAIGLDIASETNRRQAALAAMRSGEVRLSGPITLVQNIGQPLQSFLIFLPIYRDLVTPDTVEARETQALGWSYAPLITDDVLNGIRPSEDAVSLELADVTDPDQRVVFYKSLDEGIQEAVFSHTVERDVYGRRWQLHFTVHPLFISKLLFVTPWLVLGAGSLLSVLLASLVGVISQSRARQSQIIAEQLKLAAIVESSADGIIGEDLNGTVTSWNKGAEAVFGFSAEETVGQRIVDFLVPVDLQIEEIELLACIREGKPVSSFTTLRKHKNQQMIPVAITVSPIHDYSGKVVGASKTVRDISRQVADETRIVELNTTLEAQVAERTTELHELNTLLANVLRSASEVAIIATGLDGTIRIFNTGAERMLGYSAAELVDITTPASFHLADEVAARSAELTLAFSQAVEGFRVFVHKAELEGAETREWTYVRKDGSQLPVSLAVTAMRDDQGKCIGYLGIAINLTEQKFSELAVASGRDQLLMAAEVAELGIWSWDLADNSLSWNDRMFEIYGQPQSLRATGLNFEHWRSRVHLDDVEGAANLLNQAVAGEAVYAPIFRVVRPDGSQRIVQAGAQVERNSLGAVARVTGINRDITAQRELESRLLEAKEKADAASAAKSSFLANMSHEIRTPMNAVLGMLHLIQNTELTPRQLDYIIKAESAAKSLLGLLNDILDYSKIEAGKLLLDAHAFKLEQLMRDLAVVLSGNQGGKDVEVMFDIDPRLPNALYGDGQRLQQVLINLAGNALKFTQQGQVIVRVAQLLRRSDEVQVRIEVIDTGIGISLEQIQLIFEGFTQAEASTTRRFGGTGLGLVISKRLIKLMGSDLQVSSEVGVGSRFWFDIDLGICESEPLSELCPGADHQLRLLVADDNDVAGLLMVRMAEGLGWKADLVSDGPQAVARAQQMQVAGQGYDVILMDWRMPGMDGLSAAHLIHKHCRGQHGPMIIMVTAYGREVLADVQQEDEVPFAGFLTKPMTLQQLADTIQSVLVGDAPPKPSVASLRAAQPRRLAGLRLLVVEDNMLNRQVAYELLQGEGAHVALAECGLEGVDRATSTTEAFDVVLMDIQMPDIDGLEATRRIRMDAHRGGVKIIAMTANVSRSDEQACMAAGMDDHLGKPIDLEKMVAAILRHTGRTGVEIDALEPANSQVSAVEPTALILQRFGGNHPLIRNVLGSFGAEQAKQLARLQEKVNQGDVAGAAAVLHAIKGSSGTMGARALSVLAGELEQRLLHEDEASATQFLADSSWLEALHSIFVESDELLRAAFELPSHNALPTSGSSDALSKAQWREALQDILQLLQAGNMQAMERSEALQAVTPQELHAKFDLFVDQVKSLDFSGALLTGQELLNSV